MTDHILLDHFDDDPELAAMTPEAAVTSTGEALPRIRGYGEWIAVCDDRFKVYAYPGTPTATCCIEVVVDGVNHQKLLIAQPEAGPR